MPSAHGSESSALDYPTFLETQGSDFLFLFVYVHRPLLGVSTEALEHLEATENLSVCVGADLSSAPISIRGQRNLSHLEEASLTFGRGFFPKPPTKVLDRGEPRHGSVDVVAWHSCPGTL